MLVADLIDQDARKWNHNKVISVSPGAIREYNAHTFGESFMYR